MCIEKKNIREYNVEQVSDLNVLVRENFNIYALFNVHNAFCEIGRTANLMLYGVHIT